MVVALLALAVAMTGTAVAALNITGDDVKNGSLKGKDIKKDSLTGKQVKESKLGQVPSAVRADSAGTADTVGGIRPPGGS